MSYWYGVSDILMSAFQMELNDYPHFYLTEDGRLCSMGQHCPGFPIVLYDTHPSSLQRGRSGLPFLTVMVHALERWNVSETILFDPVEPWLGSVIGSEPNTIVEMMAHITLTSLCKERLTTTAALPIALLLIRNQENPVWQQRLRLCPTSRALTSTPGWLPPVCTVLVQPPAQHRCNSSSSSSTVRLLHCHSRLPSGHHNSFLPATFHVSTAGSWGTLLENAAIPTKATHRELQHPWCHTPFWDSGNEASIRVPRMFHSHI
jgi:hypothetical protein